MSKQHEKTFCMGMFCKSNDRKYTCVACHSKICGQCVRTFTKKDFCPDCLIEHKTKLLTKFVNSKIEGFFYTKEEIKQRQKEKKESLKKYYGNEEREKEIIENDLKVIC